MTSKVASKPAQRPKNKLKSQIQTQAENGNSNLQAESSTQARIRHAAAETTKARQDAGVKPKTLWSSWMSLSPSTRMKMGVAAGVFAIAGVLAADKLEASYPAKNNRPISPPSSSITTTSPVIAKERQREESAQNRPRLFGISVVEREKPMEATK